METGQPLHAFDADRIDGDRVIVQKLKKGTKFITLDGVERELSGEDLMICNENSGMCIAGVFGGLRSGVTESTVNIFLESACFDPATIRKTSKIHGLKTDASFRFERGSDINITLYALKRAALMIAEIAGGTICSEIEDVCPGNTELKQVNIRFEKLDEVAGKHIPVDEVRNIMTSLGILIEMEDETGMQLRIPSSKVDVTREIDVFEEILRIYGYNNIEFPRALRSSLSYRPKPDQEAYRNAIADFLTSKGFFEIMTNSMVSAAYSEKIQGASDPKNNVTLLNPISKELNVMRQNLLFSGLETLVYNQNRKNLDLMCYEFGKVYRFDGTKAASGLESYDERTELALFIMGSTHPEHWKRKPEPLDIFTLKQYVEQVFRRLGLDRKSVHLTVDPEPLFKMGVGFELDGVRLGFVGQLNDNLLKYFDLKQDVFFANLDWEALMLAAASKTISYTEVPKFPGVRRDLALVIEPQVTWEQLEKIAFETEVRLLKQVNLFDIYTDEKMGGKRSYALSFILQDADKTLTDREIDDIMQRLTVAFHKKVGAQLRS
jgi:phenylalanyl-tRNA synthetase beta chain